ncbi:serine-rich adhesin for platelets-like [Ruditapes philippinarum]|uniref:serine-rich adhesin for platelets-like n=1 Tax=Ruditapes philippinarum TaxID=129788 RepID=UPI00295BCECB|nr:serine-rich adhesin for platelets-like [Ruditapes philippinarum]XP_060588814.1 serine-rich adhesin for platelets-like [Ruditapes philippinarum]XP_060588815.1 serine-rich adhesin for platelets-like [Ruditapes philippinarum]XP_060588816.1 serine-rich adhesin for platelets-like [Ruditapes philippinarum]XP_060588817.1 serine-rich adhesin for platelets-like [Ruditapes philippinarum]
MALHGPASVLDSREISSKDNSSHVVRDRLTRHRSPARSSNRWSYTSEEGSDDDEVIKPKIPQPYRTSFSAIAPPDRIKRDRSRSTSPCTSSLKGSNRNRSKSPGRRSNRRVTYDETVKIRGSEASDSQVTNLSDKDLNETSGHFSADSSMMESDMSNSSQRDISMELRELTQQIVKEYSSLETKDSLDLSSQSRNQSHKSSTPNGTAKVMVSNNGSMKPRQNVKVVSEGGQKKKIIVSEDYDNERSVSYRVAVTNNYSDEIKQQAEEVMKDVSPTLVVEPAKEPTKVNETKDSKSRERHNSLPNEKGEIESSRLTPAKRSISSSIGNFFRRLSPHVGRKNKKGNLSTASSQSLSPGDELDGSFQRHNSTSSLSRGKLRKSLMKLMGKSKKSSKSSNKSDSSFEDLNLSNNSHSDGSKQTPKSALYMKSIEQTTKNDKDMYHKFKDRKKQKSGEANATGKAVKVSPKYSYADSDKPSTTETSISSLLSGDAIECDSPVKTRPPDTLDVKLVPKSIQALQALQISTISGDDSIGDCSIDPNLTGSEPSLLGDTSASKQVEVSRLSEENVNPVSSTPLASAEHKNEKDSSEEADTVLSDHKQRKELQLSYPQMPIIADTADYFPIETPTRTPSYLRISSAVSGYGHYSKYSAYKGIEKRSPYSSTLSLRSSRSDLTTPISPIDMPIGKIPNYQAPTNWPPLKNEILSPKGEAPTVELEFKKSVTNGASDKENRHVNGDLGCDVAVNGENGHVTHEGNYVLTGDNTKDGDYFLGLAQAEENRLLLLCSKCEMEMMNDSITEEGSGKVRAAVGKANLLISQKFRQFQDLCQQHKNPDPDPEVKRTLLEDLQGFWEMVKLQVDDVDEMFTEIDMMRQNGWREIKIPSRRSSSSSRSSPKSSSLNVSNASTPSHTPGSRRRAARVKDTPESSPERSNKAKMAAKVRDDARKKMLAEKRAAMKQRQQDNEAVEIYVADNGNKSDSPGRTSGSDVADA